MSDSTTIDNTLIVAGIAAIGAYALHKYGGISTKEAIIGAGIVIGGALIIYEFDQVKTDLPYVLGLGGGVAALLLFL